MLLLLAVVVVELFLEMVGPVSAVVALVDILQELHHFLVHLVLLLLLDPVVQVLMVLHRHHRLVHRAVVALILHLHFQQEL
jgi:hypothetical protein